MGRGENLFTVAHKYGTDWMALWSLNGDDTPEVRSRSTTYRFAHEYHVRAGESMEMIAQRFGVTVENIVDLNRNQFTHIQNPFRVKEGDIICIAPMFHRTMVSDLPLWPPVSLRSVCEQRFIEVFPCGRIKWENRSAQVMPRGLVSTRWVIWSTR